MGHVQETMASAPSKQTIGLFDDYLAALGTVWDSSWKYHVRLKLRKIKFFAWRRREAWMDKLVNRIKDYSSGTVLFGDGANSGLFGKLRGGGVKGPVLEIKKRLGKKMAVVDCSEFRTSKLCLDCGREAKFHNHGVTYCAQQSHHRMANRDVVAAYKIGARYLAVKQGLDLGPWSRSVLKNALEPSTVLREVLTSYQSETFTPLGGSNVSS